MLLEAVAGFRIIGDQERADEASVDLAQALAREGDEAGSHALADELVSRLEPRGASKTLTEALNLASRDFYLDPLRIEQQERAIAMADELGLRDQHNRLIAERALRRVNTGDVRGMEDLRSSLAEAIALGDQEHVARMYYWLGSCIGGYEDPLAGLEFFEEGLAFTRRRGFRNFEFYIRQDRWFPLFRLGRWNEILEDVEAQIQDARHLGLGLSRTMSGKIAVLSLTGHELEAASLAVEDPEQVTRAYAYGTQRIRGLRSGGDDGAAMALLVDAAVQMREDGHTLQGNDRLDFVLEAIALGRIDLARDIASMRTLQFSVDYLAEEIAVTAELAEAEGDVEAAARSHQDARRAWLDLKNPYQTAMAAIGAGRCLIRLGRAPEAVLYLAEAREIFERLGAAPALAETEALLRQAGAPRT